MIRLQNPYQRGPEILNIQKALILKGFQLAADGIYGPNTEQAVRLFQQKYGLKADGIVGPTTKQYLLGGSSRIIYNNLEQKGGSRRILASAFTDEVGNIDDNDLYDGGLYYAELEMGTSLGGLKNWQKAKITYNGKTVIALRGDIGKGGPKNPKIDLHESLCTALGIKNPDNFLDYVDFELIQ